MKCIIPCAGESSRMSYIPKHLLQVGGQPLLCHIVDAWGGVVDSYIFILKRSMAYMWGNLPENSVVVFQDEPKGLADAILRAEPYVSGKFVVALGDCLFVGKFEERPFDLGVGVWKTEFPGTELFKNFLVRVKDDRIISLEEKPQELITGGYCGMGVYFLDDRVFDYIRKRKADPSGGDLTEVLQAMIDDGEIISPVWLKGEYVNISSPEDIATAERMLNG